MPFLNYVPCIRLLYDIFRPRNGGKQFVIQSPASLTLTDFDFGLESEVAGPEHFRDTRQPGSGQTSSYQVHLVAL